MFNKVYKLVKKIPAGKVVTYGQIASILDTKDARKVGFALHTNKSNDVPCHRVVNKEGRLAKTLHLMVWRNNKGDWNQKGLSLT